MVGIEFDNLVELEPLDNFQGTYSQYYDLDEREDLYRDLMHKNNIQRILRYDVGMGYFCVMVHSNGHYHCLMLGGSSGHDRLESFVNYMLYNFDDPCGWVEDLKDDTIIIPRGLSLKEPAKKLYAQMILDLPAEKSDYEFYEEFVMELSKIHCE